MIKISKGLLASDIRAYSEDGAKRKVAFHKDARAFLRALAHEIGLSENSYDIRSNQGGVAVSGEVTLHAEHIYIQLSESCVSPGISVMYRTCAGRKDYTGGQNNFVSTQNLQLSDRQAAFVRSCRLLAKTYYMVDDRMCKAA